MNVRVFLISDSETIMINNLVIDHNVHMVTCAEELREQILQKVASLRQVECAVLVAQMADADNARDADAAREWAEGRHLNYDTNSFC